MSYYVGSFQFKLPEKIKDRYKAPITEEGEYRKCPKNYVGGGNGCFPQLYAGI